MFRLINFFILTILPVGVLAEENKQKSFENIEQINSASYFGGFDMLTLILLFLSITLAAVSIFVSYKFYMWRSRVEVTGALVPEKWADHLYKLGQKVEKNDQTLAENINLNIQITDFLNKTNKVTTENINQVNKAALELKEMLLKFQTALDEKDKEISRLKEGYDFVILKKEMKSLSNLHFQICELISTDPANKNLKTFEVLLRDHLENVGIELENLGKDFSLLSDYVDVVGHISDINQD